MRITKLITDISKSKRYRFEVQPICCAQLMGTISMLSKYLPDPFYRVIVDLQDISQLSSFRMLIDRFEFRFIIECELGL